MWTVMASYKLRKEGTKNFQNVTIEKKNDKTRRQTDKIDRPIVENIVL